MHDGPVVVELVQELLLPVWLVQVWLVQIGLLHDGRGCPVAFEGPWALATPVPVAETEGGSVPLRGCGKSSTHGSDTGRDVDPESTRILDVDAEVEDVMLVQMGTGRGRSG